MKKLTNSLLVLLFIFFTTSVSAEMTKEGSHSGKNYSTGTSKAIPMGEERLHLTIEGSGIYVSDEEDGFLNNASMHLLGTDLSPVGWTVS